MRNLPITLPMRAASLVLFCVLLAACGYAQPTATAQPAMPTATTRLATPTAGSVPVDCGDQALVESGAYRAENNTWGKGGLTGWSQCVGIETGPDGALSGRWTWDWPQSGNNVKAYPEIIFGQKPGSSTTTADLPLPVNRVGEFVVSYDITTTHSGSGNLAFDVWLTDTQDPATWGVPPISHEIMIWLDAYGGMRPGGVPLEQVDIDGVRYDVSVGYNYGDGWTYVAFKRVEPHVGAGSLDLAAFLAYLQSKALVTGEEYVASLEFGNEVIGGTGETVLHRYQVSVSALPAAAALPATPTLQAAATGGQEEEQNGVFLRKTFVSENGGSIPYQFLIPEVFSADQAYPLFVFLHGAGELGSDNRSQLAGFPHALLDGHHKSQYPAFVVAPQCPASDSWSSFPGYPNSTRASQDPTNATRLVIELIEDLLRTYNIDASRVYVVGFSLGGEGAFDIVSRRPDLFAAAVPICGIADVERASSMKDVPFWVFHGEKDDINPVKHSRAIVEALEKEGASPKYTEYKGAGHSIWSRAYSEPDFFSWLFAQRKK
ncbi:MAG: GH12 family glycosyl hydrolase domain-containing protein [Chloroflexota bacterium]